MSRPPHALGRRGFTLTELLAVAVIFAILLSIFIPFLRAKWEDANRVRCADNLRQIRAAFEHYLKQNGDTYPATRGDPQKPTGYCAFTGPDAADPFAAGAAVRPNDVTASLWLLVRSGLAEPRMFVCPSTSDAADTAAAAAGAPRSNFRGGANLSYSYATPFAAPTDYRLKGDWLKPGFAVIADRNPGINRAGGDDVLATGDAAGKGNSRNHRKAGQNVLFGTGEVAFVRTPYTGEGGDNIYTAQRAVPLARGETNPAATPGVLDPNVGPAWAADSYLVPTAQEGAR